MLGSLVRVFRRRSEVARFAFDPDLDDAPLADGRAGQLGRRGDDLGLVARTVREPALVLDGPGAVMSDDPENKGWHGWTSEVDDRRVRTMRAKSPDGEARPISKRSPRHSEWRGG